jgi:hypothetical protein
MKRIEILYGGVLYTIADRSLEQVRDEVITGLSAGPTWLTVNYGEGALAVTQLLLTPGVPLALTLVGPDDTE